MIRYVVWPAIRRWKSTVSILGIVVALASLGVSHWVASSIVNNVTRYGSYWDFSYVELTKLVSYAVMAACSIIFLLTRSPKVFRVALFVKVSFFVLYVMTIRYPNGKDYFTLSIVLFEIILYEAFWVNLVIAGVVCSFWVGVPLATRGVTWHVVLPSLLAHASMIFPLGMLVYYRERFIHQQERLEQMDKVVSRLTETNMGYRHYAEEASARSEEDERLRITRELHDIIGYTFTNNIMMMEAAYAKIQKEPERVANLIALARENASEGLIKIRKTLYRLRDVETARPTSLSRFMKVIELFEIATNVEVETEWGGLIGRLPGPVEDFIYFFIQEGLTNAFLHGGATRVTVRLGSGGNLYHAIIQDNGHGAKVIKEGIGMRGMRERLAALKGRMEIINNDLGFMIQCEIPIPENET